jgi:hypothetical protein
MAPINDGPGIVAIAGGTPVGVLLLDVTADGRVASMQLIANPEKLAHLSLPALG